MGDLLQTSPLLKGLKEQDPEGRLDLMVVEDFRAVAGGFDMVDEILTLDLNGLIPQFDQPDKTVVDLHHRLKEWIESVRRRSYDRLINLSHTRISAALARLLDVPDTRGVTLSKDGYILIRHPWSNYFFNVTLSRTYNPINLVDMYLGVGDITNPPQKLYFRVEAEARSFADDFFREHGSHARRPLYGIQPGAMQENRRWQPDRWAELCDRIWDQLGGVAIVFGALSDSDIGRRIEQQVKNPLINAIGRTTIPQLAALLTRCQTLITNDTGTMHLAAAVETPIVAIFLAAARADDTAPYGRGHMILEANIECAPCNYDTVCPNPVCHEMVTPDIVLATIRDHPVKHGGIPPDFPDEEDLTRIRISMTDFDPWGMSILHPCIKRPLSRKQILSTAYRYLWRTELQGNHYNHYELSLRTKCGNLLPSSYHLLLRDVIKDWEVSETSISFQDDCDSLDKLEELATLGLQRAETLAHAASQTHPDRQLLQNITAHLAVIDKDIYAWELTHPDLAPLAIHFRIDKGNIDNDDLKSLAYKAQTLYGDLKRRAERFQTLLRRSEQFLAHKRQSPIGKVMEIL